MTTNTFQHDERTTLRHRAVANQDTSHAMAPSAVPAIQKKSMEDEELQLKSAVQLATPEEDELQMKSAGSPKNNATSDVTQRKDNATPETNHTGMPDRLKTGIENLSGFSMDDVKVHYNSSQPAQLNALAYAQGTDIHISPWQERHLPHEAWHVVQQKQGRVKPTMQMKGGINVNDDKGLEKEADVMGVESLKIPMAAFNGKDWNGRQGIQFKAENIGLPIIIMQKLASNSDPIQLKDEIKIGGKKYALGSFKKVEGIIGRNLSEDEKLIVTHWMKQEIEFIDANEFTSELNTLLPNWEKQKVFYPTTTGVSTAQDVNSTVRLYSSRSLDAVDKLYLWATQNGITTSGFNDPANSYIGARNPNGAALNAPIKAHFGDKVHTIKHWNQKKTSGGGVGLISIDLNANGVNAIKKEKSEGNITKGGEGYKTGKIGLKSEKNFYSAAIGDNATTWDKLKSQIHQITLHDWQP